MSDPPTVKEQEILFGEDGLKRYYKKIKKILEEYMDLEEKYISLVSLWIVGTFLHKQFSCFPYLFFNAMRGSGKTRILKMISGLAKNGKLVGNMTEAVLFRTASQRTLCIDEFEGNAKGNENLKLLLNSAYKKGGVVERLRKIKGKDGEEQVVEEFQVFSPLTMANIWGLNNVLEDRCIKITLEKSSKSSITKLIENFENNLEFQKIRGGLNRLTEKITPELDIFGNLFDKWNFYQKNIVNKVSIVSKVNVSNEVKNIDDIYDIDDITTLFQSINETNLDGRHLELFFPLYVIADICGKEILSELLITSQEIVKLKKETDREESKDVQLIEFISQSNYEGYIEVAKIVKDLKEYFGEEEVWMNSRGISRALNRLKFIIGKRSTGKRKQVKLNIEKAQQKLLMFKEPEEIDFSKSGIKEVLEDES